MTKRTDLHRRGLYSLKDPCPRCGHHYVRVQGPGRGATLKRFVLNLTLVGAPFARGATAARAICANCGRTRMVYYPSLDER